MFHLEIIGKYWITFKLQNLVNTKYNKKLNRQKIDFKIDTEEIEGINKQLYNLLIACVAKNIKVDYKAIDVEIIGFLYLYVIYHFNVFVLPFYKYEL